MWITFERQRGKITLMAILLASCCFMIYYFQVIFQTGTVFTHFFYIPIILASLWWKRKGLTVAIFLGVILLFSHHFLRDYPATANNYFRALMFVAIGSVAALLSERISRAQEKVAHLYAVLHAIRGVNQLITREKNRDLLLQGICETLIETRGYHNTWIAMLGENGEMITTAEAGLGKDSLPMIKHLKRGKLPACGQKALEQSDIVVTRDPISACTDCPLSAMCGGRGAMTIRLKHDGKLYGLLSASIPVDLAEDEKEHFLFKDVAGDIAFALYSLELNERGKRYKEKLRRHRDNLEGLVKERTVELTRINEQLQQEITEHQRAKEALLQSEKKYQNLFNNALVGLYRKSIPDGIMIECNRQTALLLGYANPEDLIGIFKAQEHYVDPAKREEFLGIIRETGRIENFEIQIIRKDGSYFWANYSAQIFPDEGYLEGTIINITERKILEEQLLKSKAMLQSVFDGISDPLIVFGQDLSINALNNAAMKYCQISELKNVIKRHCFEALRGKESPCEECMIPSAVQDGKETTFEQRNPMFPDRFERVVVYPLREKEGDLTGAIVTKSDITEKRKTEEQLIRADRLSSLGQLSGGIAHEIRNPLSSISLFMDILSDKERFEHTDRELEIFSEVKESVNRIAGIINRVLNFSRLQAVHKSMTDINDLIKENLKLWQTSIGNSKIKLELSLDKGLPQIFGDTIQIQQVFNNLVLNAIEAMDKGGTLRITTSKGISSVVREREVIVTQVKDTGRGIDPEDMENIFNPFFTTKTMGTGLGLAISHKIVERHGGITSVESKPNEGTTFSIELPIVEG